jgi:flagellar hook-associated protein 1
MSTNVYGIGISGLKAAQLSLMVTGHNITNATTDGFHRQSTALAPRTPRYTGDGFIGQGVQNDNIVRVYDQFIDKQVMQAETQKSYFDRYEFQMNQIDEILTDPGTGLSPALQDFFKGVQEVTTRPESIPVRQDMLSNAAGLVGRLHLLDTRLSEIREGLNEQVISSVAEINSYAQQIADLNQKIIVAQSSSSGQAPNDLLDQRGVLIGELNKRVQVTVVEQDSGAANVYIGKGQSLVIGTDYAPLMARPDSDDPERLALFYDAPSGPDVVISPDLLSGGELGSLLNFRDEVLDPEQNRLGLIALGLAETFNAQHRLGQDLNGALGGDFFSIGALTAISSGSNTGTGRISLDVADVAALTAQDYRLSYDGAQYTLLNTDTNTSQTFATLPQTVDGLTISLSGVPLAGDVFELQPTRFAARNIDLAISDPRLIAAASPVRSTAASSNLGSANITAPAVLPTTTLNPNLTAPVTITFNNPPTTFNVTGTGTGNPVNQPYTSGSALSFNGWQLNLSGTPRAGDSFTVAANTSGISDNRNALELAGLQVDTVLLGGTASYQSAYSRIVNSVGNRTREMQINTQAQDTVVAQAKATRESVAGVNLDEEAANLMRFQSQYQAAAKVIQSAEQMLNTLLDIAR